jgi:YcxB-like protein
MYHLEYRVSLQHWAEYAGLVQTRTRRAGLGQRLGSSVVDALVAGVLAGLGLYAAHFYFDISDTLAMAMLGAFVLFYSLGIIVCARYSRARDAGNPARDGFLIGQRSTTVTDEYVEVLSDRVKTRFEWRAFERVERLPRMIVLWLEPGAGVVIPRTAFQSDGEAAGFFEFATDCINQPRPSKRKKIEPAPAKSKPADEAVAGAAE